LGLAVLEGKCIIFGSGEVKIRFAGAITFEKARARRAVLFLALV
jgi:hypothetical protein